MIDKYLVPFFGDIFVTSIHYQMLQGFTRWREAKMGREPRSSMRNTHNSALNRIFDEAVARGYMNKSKVPVLVNKGRDRVRVSARCGHQWHIFCPDYNVSLRAS